VVVANIQVRRKERIERFFFVVKNLKTEVEKGSIIIVIVYG